SNGSAYLSVFAQQKTPLSNLFEGSKLFLSPLQEMSLPELALDEKILSNKPLPAPLIGSDRRITGNTVQENVTNTATAVATRVKIELAPETVDDVSVTELEMQAMPKLTGIDEAAYRVPSPKERAEIAAVLTDKRSEIGSLLKKKYLSRATQFTVESV